MFGTLKPVYGRLAPEEKSVYKMYYCGLCTALGRMGGPALRMGLSYDMAFVYMLLDLGSRRQPGTCFCPGKLIKRQKCIDNKALSDYVAAASLALIHGKCLDNLHDGEHQLSSNAILFLTRRETKKISANYSAMFEVVKNALAEMTVCEDDKEKASLESLADQFGMLTGKIFEGAPNIEEPKLYYKLGYWVGRWIYIADAALDMAEDIQKKRFNPFVLDSKLTKKQAVEVNEVRIRDELFRAHDCIVDILKLADAYEDVEQIVKIISIAMETMEGTIFKLQEGIKDAK